MAKTTRHTISYTIRIDPKDAIRKLNRVEKELDDLSKPQRASLKVDRGAAGRGIQERPGTGPGLPSRSRVIPSVGVSAAGGERGSLLALGKSAAVAAGAIYGVQKAFQSIKGTISIASRFEQQQKRLQFLFGKGWKDALKNFRELAETTPFAEQQIVDAAAQLKAFKIVGDRGLRAVVDFAAGVQRPVTEIANTLGRFNAGSYGEAIARFRELGLTAADFEEAGAKFSKSGQYLAQGGGKDLEIALDAIEKKFGGMGTDMLDTWEAASSNLSASFKNFWNEFAGKDLIDALKPVANSLTEFFKGAADIFGPEGGVPKGLPEQEEGLLEQVRVLEDEIEERRRLMKVYAASRRRNANLRDQDAKYIQVRKGAIEALKKMHKVMQENVREEQEEKLPLVAVRKQIGFGGGQTDPLGNVIMYHPLKAPLLLNPREQFVPIKYDAPEAKIPRAKYPIPQFKHPMEKFGMYPGGPGMIPSPLRRAMARGEEITPKIMEDNRQYHQTFNQYGVPTPQMSGLAQSAGMQ